MKSSDWNGQYLYHYPVLVHPFFSLFHCNLSLFLFDIWLIWLELLNWWTPDRQSIVGSQRWIHSSIQWIQIRSKFMLEKINNVDGKMKRKGKREHCQKALWNTFRSQFLPISIGIRLESINGLLNPHNHKSCVYSSSPSFSLSFPQFELLSLLPPSQSTIFSKKPDVRATASLKWDLQFHLVFEL